MPQRLLPPLLQPTTAPLCVDLDGTLLDTDLLYESLLVLLARNPLYLFLLPFWLLQAGRTEAADRCTRHHRSTPPALQPESSGTAARHGAAPAGAVYRLGPAAGRADRRTHLGLFEQVIASDGQHNLSGTHKAQALVDAFGERGFDYAGNGTVDLAVGARAAGAWVVNNRSALAGAAAQRTQLLGHWPAPSRLQAWLKALRPHQWLKNLLVFVPVLTAHRFLEAPAVTDALLAFAAFSLCASGVYLLNDLLDLDADRRHPRKRHRPFAAGRLPLLHGLVAGPLTLCGWPWHWPATLHSRPCWRATTR